VYTVTNGEITLNYIKEDEAQLSTDYDTQHDIDHTINYLKKRQFRGMKCAARTAVTTVTNGDATD